MTMRPMCLAISLAATLAGHSAFADTLPEPTDPVILTITGAITNTTSGGAAQFDLAALKALGESEIVTETIWTSGVRTFTGVRLHKLLDHVGAEGETLSAYAINDYRVEIPVSDATQDGPILAYAMDGAAMSRREKGPLWVIYPFSDSAEFRTEVIYARSIWQLDRIVVDE
ncbi:molybdopterin-dependent oxidoreductase [Primorskyibacter sp. 2E107]|uniref:molybdopterin-dependent oxidoreductase n=1 Tax=Primorskyibacter sp. 2E107 TaxID=3403458 RepID=UPI003AF6BAE7